MEESVLSNGGKVYLVGAGPGDPGLVTVKGLRLLESADVIVHDRLISERLLAMVGHGVELVDVGKVPGRDGQKQSDINSLMVIEARKGKVVVRLKGGDPFVFGRGGEEAEALSDAGVPFEVVPGVTSAVAVPAYAGIPVTHRDYSSSFTVVTGSSATSDGKDSSDWRWLAETPGTLVILMGWSTLPEIAAALVEHGKLGSTPSAVISWGSDPRQRSATGPLDSIAEIARSQGLTSPAVVVIGDVAYLKNRLNWFESLPLLGLRLLITRTRNQAGTLSQRLSDLGAIPVEIPTIEVRPPQDYSALDAACAELSKFDWIVFASSNAVRAVFDRLSASGRDSRALYGANVAAIGSATADTLTGYGIVADVVPTTATSTGLANALVEMGVGGSQMLLPRADIATQELPEMLIAHGAVVSEVIAYETVVPLGSRDRAVEAIRTGVDVVIFTSSSTVRNLLRLLDNDPVSLANTRIACIGPTTAATAGRLGLKVDIVSKTPTISGLTETLVEYFKARK